MTRPGGVYRHDDDYPEDRSSGPELDPQKDLVPMSASRRRQPPRLGGARIGRPGDPNVISEIALMLRAP